MPKYQSSYHSSQWHRRTRNNNLELEYASSTLNHSNSRMILRASMLISLLSLKGHIMRGTLLLLSVGFRYLFSWLLFLIGYDGEGDSQ